MFLIAEHATYGEVGAGRGQGRQQQGRAKQQQRHLYSVRRTRLNETLATDWPMQIAQVIHFGGKKLTLLFTERCARFSAG